MSDALTRLRRLARPMAWLTTLSIGAIPAFWAIAIAYGSYTRDRLAADLLVEIPVILPATNVLAVQVADGVAIALLLVVLWHMRHLFMLFAQGDVLGPNAARTIRRIGLWLLVTAGFGVVNHTLSILALTLPNPEGQRSLSVQLSSQEVFLMVSAGLLVAIGWAMSEAARIAEENRSFV